jgi:nucleotide-binding universal stress UspA family protein
MINRILVPVDGSEHATRAVERASDLASRYGAELTLLHVVAHEGSFLVPTELQGYAQDENASVTEADLIREAAAELIERARSRTAAAGLERVHTVIESGDPATRIVSYADEHGIDLIVMGRRGMGELAGLLIGSVSQKVAHLAACSCLTVK